MFESTLLRLSPISVPPYSARGISQTLGPIDSASAMRRTVNGKLIDLSFAGFRKFRSSITCTDQQHPALSGVWPGMELVVDCVAELSYLTAGGAPARPLASTTDDEAIRVEGAFTFYRPRLVMLVADYSISTDEWGAEVGWSLDLAEV
ncbi:hypothetical protein [Pseudaminobacter soli (ex Li et al. 2025)]|uniref:Uncharacterized protein n=1 Tax=Pseudaminobacter soli (ex Li et al. 2025) TaxID=1295366 RepID=A0A2P7RZW2_9HYPH|nr:hypothetical protein [Mesorhizobium soli]PSJ55759.1 hypothetical protein C7I85_26065 [Mesorhizobium soli]